MVQSLRDELASLKIERQETRYRPVAGRAKRSGSGGLRWLSGLLWLIPIGLITGAGLIVWQQYDQIKPRAEVSVGLVQEMTSGEAETLLSAKGYIQSRNQAMIGAKMPGRVEAMLVEEGTRVKKGQVLAVLEHNDIQAQLESRQAMVERSKAELAQARSDFELKDRKAKRWIQLLHSKSATVEEADQYLSERNQASARVRALEAGLLLQEAMVRETQETINNMHILAPFDGTVVAKEAEVGETITPGGMGAASGRGSVVTLANLDQLEVETDISENLLSRIAVGQPAEISVSAVPGMHYQGKLRQIIPMGDRTRGTVKVNVEILDPDEHLFPELVATVHFLPDDAVNNPNAGKAFLFVPKAALIEEAGHTYAWVVDDRGTLHRERVEVVVTNDDLARVEKGLKAGDRVVLNPERSLVEGALVKVAD